MGIVDGGEYYTEKSNGEQGAVALVFKVVRRGRRNYQVGCGSRMR